MNIVNMVSLLFYNELINIKNNNNVVHLNKIKIYNNLDYDNNKKNMCLVKYNICFIKSDQL